jgi:hypothetical protein
MRLGAEFLFVLTEATAWYAVLRAFSSLLERSSLSDLAANIERLIEQAQFTDITSATEAARIARAASEQAVAGPAYWVVLVAAFGAYALSRGVTRARIGGVGTLLGLLITFLALNALFHIVLAGDLRVWDSEGLARFLDRPDSPLRAPPDPVAFVANPDLDVIEGRSYTLLVAGLTLMWVRFLLAGRGVPRFERALRSFSMSFPAVLAAVFVASVASIGIGVAAVSYFVFGVFSLSIANAARTTDPSDSLARRAPWAVSVTVTLAALAAIAALLSLLAALNVGELFALVGGGVMRVVAFVLVLVLTPVFWVVERILGSIIGVTDFSFLQRALENAQVLDPEAEREEGQFSFPGWIRDLLRLLGFGIAAAIIYFLGRLIFRRTERAEEGDYIEERSVSSGVGLGGLLGNLIPGRAGRAPGDDGWAERHAAYRLYRRAVWDSTERQFAPRAGETPIEFAAAASHALDAPPLVPIAEEFDRARYGRHFASTEDLAPLEASLAAWETGSPITDEIRSRPARGEEAPEIRIEPEVEAPDTPAGPLPPPI